VAERLVSPTEAFSTPVALSTPEALSTPVVLSSSAALLSTAVERSTRVDCTTPVTGVTTDIRTDTVAPKCSSAADGQVVRSSRRIASETEREDTSEDMEVTRATKNAADRWSNSVQWRLVLHSSP
jgi:hypothetical protein